MGLCIIVKDRLLQDHCRISEQEYVKKSKSIVRQKGQIYVGDIALFIVKKCKMLCQGDIYSSPISWLVAVMINVSRFVQVACENKIGKTRQTLAAIERLDKDMVSSQKVDDQNGEFWKKI